jgi:hypothetical protein
MPSVDCAKFNDFLFRRVPDFDKALARDRQPFSYLYSNMYAEESWPSFTGTTHTWDKVHVTRPNDTGNWDAMNSDSCAQTICDPTRLYTGWGSTRNTYTKYHRDYQTPVFCFDQLRHVEEAQQQLSAIIQGHKKLPEGIISDFLRMLSIRQSDKIHICSAAGTTVTTVDTMFKNNMLDIDLGSAANLPTSKLSMNYLDAYIEVLMYNGYFDQEFIPTGKYSITTDLQTLRDLANQNPALAAMYTSADFQKGGKFYEYGVMNGVGNWLFKVDPEPLRFQHIGSGVLRRIFPYQNIAATVGKKPVFDTAYLNAEYQMYHVYNRAARTVYGGDLSPVNPEMKFSTSRNLMGKWSWKNPDYFTAVDPTNGVVCSYQNDKKNKGYFLAEFEMGTKTVYPEIERVIIAKRETQPVVDVPRCASSPAMIYQTLTPYNSFCELS